MFLTNISEEKYNQLAKETNNEHFLHGVRWAKFRESINWNYEIVGYEVDDNLVLAAVIMFKKAGIVPYKVAYSSRGYLISDKTYEAEFTKELKKYLKKQGAFVYKIDPNEIYSNLDKSLERIGENKQYRVEELIDLGYKHLGFVNNFEGMQPRHSIRIDTTTSYDDALKRMDAKTRNRVKSGVKNGLVVEQASLDQLPIFMNLLKETSERDNFTIRDISYFSEMGKAFGDDLKLRLAKVDFESSIKKLSEESKSVQAELEELKVKVADPNLGEKYQKKMNNRITEFETKLAKNENVIAEFTKQLEEHPDGKYIGGALYICEGKRAWYVYGATSNSFRHMLPSYALVGRMIEECIDMDFEYFDMFGIGGDFDKDNHVFGLYDFKKGFGGQAVEFIGEFDLPIRKTIFFGFDRLYPMLKNLKKRR